MNRDLGRFVIRKDGDGTGFRSGGRKVILGDGRGGRSAERAEKQLKSVTIVVTGLVERQRATHVGFSLKISA
jgi:hypothetical protein